MGTQRIPNYGEFWKFYVSQHSKASTRGLHFVGTSFVIGLFIASFFTTFWLLLGLPVAGYFFAWVGHFGYEKNRPATFTYPIWSLIADFQMFFFALTGRMKIEVKKYGDGSYLKNNLRADERSPVERSGTS